MPTNARSLSSDPGPDDYAHTLAAFYKAGGKSTFFIGAGGSASAGVPLADQLANEVAESLGLEGSERFGGGLEQLMAHVKKVLGKDGYRILTSRLRGYREPPEGYSHLMDLAKAGHAAAIVTVNLAIRRSRHCRASTPISISAIFNQLPCLGV